MDTVKIHSTDDDAGFVVAIGVGLSVIRCTVERDWKGNMSLSEK